jgi:hypothetical protein
MSSGCNKVRMRKISANAGNNTIRRSRNGDAGTSPVNLFICEHGY